MISLEEKPKWLIFILCYLHSEVTVTPDEVKSTISSLKDSGCHDIYELNTAIIKPIADIIAEPLAFILNHCFSLGIFPDALKISVILPLLKKGDPQVMNNFRPISIIPIIAKIIEILVKQRLISYLEVNGLLCPGQFGFRKGFSTTQALLDVVSKAVDGLEKGEHSQITLCDLTKAFDCVSHDILVEKLFHYGIRGIPLEFFKSYLRGRSQCVLVNGVKSELEEISHGVPQGSVLGPSLFILYINDLYYHVLPKNCILFADDTTIIDQNSNIHELTLSSTHTLEMAEKWFSSNKLMLNAEKTQSLLISSNATIAEGKWVKLLGIHIDDKLNWLCHINKLASRLSSAIFLIRRLKYSVGIGTLRSSYFGLFHSHMTYGLILWGSSCHASKIFILQKRVVRVMSGAGYSDHCRPLFIRLQIMPLPTAYIFYTLIEIHKNRLKFPIQSDIHPYPTRSSNLLRTARYRLTVSQKNSLNFDFYNKLPIKIRQVNDFQFKTKIKSFLLKKCFYSADEFLNYSFTADDL